MNKIPTLILIAAGLFCVAAVQLAAQNAEQSPRLLVGAQASAEFGWTTASVPVFADAPDCGEFTDGNSLGGSIGATMSRTRVAGPIGFTASLLFNLASHRLEALPSEPSRIFDDSSRAIVQLDREYRRDVVEPSISLHMLARVDLGGRMWLEVGPSLTTVLGSTVEQTDNVTGPGPYRFADGQSSHAMDGAHGATTSGLVAAGTLMLGRSFEVGDRTSSGIRTLEPYVGIRADMTSRISDATLRVFAIDAGVRLMFDITPMEVTPPVEPIAVHREPARERRPPHATLAIFGIDSNGLRHQAPLITVQELVEFDYAPIVPALFFDTDSVSIPLRYALHVDRASVTGDERIVSVQREILDTIGARLKSRPDAHIELWGSTAAGESPAIAARRVETVRQYLATTWSIDAGRLVARSGTGPLQRSTEAGEDGRADNRRVEFRTSDDAILAPVILSHTSRVFDPPAIELVKTIDAPEGIRSWSIDLRHRDRNIASFNSDSSRTDERLNPVWNILSSEIDSSLGTLAARLDVVDSVGATARATAETYVRLARELRSVDRRVELLDDREVIRHILVAFEFDQHSPGPMNEREINAISARVRTGATVRVVGTADRIGEGEHNIDLARRRATAVAAVLRSSLATRGVTDVSIAIESTGMSRRRFTNDLPEGRFLSRGVEVTIEQLRAK